MKHAAGRKKTTAGFTLVEFLIAATLLALMAAVVSGSLRVALNIYTKSQELLDAEGRRRVLEDMVRRQLGSLYPLTPVLNVGGAAMGTAPGITPPGSSLGVDPLQDQAPLFYGSPSALTFVTVAPFEMLRKPGLTVVLYGHAEDEWGDRYFGALETRYTGPESFYQMLEVPEGEPIPVIEPVEDLTFEYYWFDQQTGVGEWYEEWSALDTLSVPSAVRITADRVQIVVTINTTAVPRVAPPGQRMRQLFEGEGT